MKVYRYEPVMFDHVIEPLCKHCRIHVFFDHDDGVWRHDGHEGETCGSLSPDTSATPTWPVARTAWSA